MKRINRINGHITFTASLILIFLFLRIDFAYAVNNLVVEKLIQNKGLKVGDDVTIILKFTNPYQKQFTIKIKDKNVFGNNGIDVQCLEYIIPLQKEVSVAYEPIKVYKSGKYNLEPAEITYTNPDTNKEESIKSNTLDVTVKDSNNRQGEEHGITSIYRCGGISMQSTSYSSSGGSFNVQIGNSNTQSGFDEEENNQQSSPANRVQNNQLNQNANELKQQLAEQIEEQKRMEEQFQKNLADNRDFQSRHHDLLGEGYKINDTKLNPFSNNTGKFEISYSSDSEETATLRGEMVNGTMKQLLSQTAEDRSEIIDKLADDKQFANYNKKLISEGFNQSLPLFNIVSQNLTKITLPYKNKKNIENKIIADYINDSIKNVALEEEKNTEKKNWQWLLLIPLLMALAWLVYSMAVKIPMKQVYKSEAKKPEPEVDYLNEALNMLAESEKAFAGNKEKDAYEMVSQAIRFYFSYKLGIKKELNIAELMSALKKDRLGHLPYVEDCLNLCTMIEFAKYTAERKDFEHAVMIARSVIKP